MEEIVKNASKNTKSMESNELFMSHLLEFRQVNPEAKITNLKDSKVKLKKQPDKVITVFEKPTVQKMEFQKKRIVK